MRKMTIKRYLKEAQYVFFGKKGNIYHLYDPCNDEAVYKSKLELEKTIKDHLDMVKYYGGNK